jgi:futalosine hydrolase
MIALIAAVPLETELLRRRLAPCEVRRCNGCDLFRGTIFGRPVCLLHSGIGKANAAAAAMALLADCRPTALIMLGCGGAYPESGLAVGDLALASEEIFGDEGMVDNRGFHDLQELGYPMRHDADQRRFNNWPVDNGLHDWAQPILAQHAAERGRNFCSGPFVTVSRCTGSSALSMELEGRTGGICENMEGAAVAQVCTQQHVPFLEVRGISNLVEDRDLARWDLRRGAEMAQQAVQTLLSEWQASKVPA